jgi:hypothetical protein
VCSSAFLASAMAGVSFVEPRGHFSACVAVADASGWCASVYSSECSEWGEVVFFGEAWSSCAAFRGQSHGVSSSHLAVASFGVAAVVSVVDAHWVVAVVAVVLFLVEVVTHGLGCFYFDVVADSFDAFEEVGYFVDEFFFSSLPCEVPEL